MACGHREVLIRGYVDEVMISCGAEVIARHRRCTWRSLIRNPTAAAHGLGKLLKYVGRSNVLWGTGFDLVRPGIEKIAASWRTNRPLHATRSATSGPSGGMRDGRVLSRSRPS